MTLAFTDDYDADQTSVSWWEELVLPLLPAFPIEDHQHRYWFKAFNGKLFLVKEEVLSNMQP